MKLLTEKEAAEILRSTAAKIKRLRFSGELPYLPGRPVLIDAADLDQYLAARKVRGGQNAAQAETPKSSEAAREDARAWALKQVLLRPSPRRRSAPR